jgi:photosystem II stability/assembly factor-like uncharacterized protein
MKKLLFTFAILSVNFYPVISQTWSLHQQRPDLELSDIEFLNANEGFVFGDSIVNGVDVAATILKTTDGGLNWTTSVLSNPNYSITKSFFLNSLEGFIAGRNGGGNSGLFLKTIDGGVTWTTPAIFTERLFNVCFLNSSIGWVMGKDGFLSKTTDGGMAWNFQSVTNEDINAMNFFNSSQGVMVCGEGEIYITSDAGVTWTLAVSNATEDLASISINNNNAWVCGAGGTLLFSSDAGQSWTLQTAALNIDFNDISFPDVTNGFTAGIAGFINYTPNGGSLWQNQISNCQDEIIALSVPDNNHGWFCTENKIYSLNSTTGVSEIKKDESLFNIFPIPAGEKIEIKGNGSTITAVRIFDIKGGEWLNQLNLSGNKTYGLSIENLIPGMYIAEISSNQKKYYLKFTKAESN